MKRSFEKAKKAVERLFRDTCFVETFSEETAAWGESLHEKGEGETFPCRLTEKAEVCGTDGLLTQTEKTVILLYPTEKEIAAGSAVRIRQENGAAVFSLHIDAAGEDAATRVVTLHVRADEPPGNIKERLLGATLAWQTDAGETQLGEAACVRVYQPMVFGLTKDEWMGILWAGLLLVVTVSCLFAAFNSENKREKYCE